MKLRCLCQKVTITEDGTKFSFQIEGEHIKDNTYTSYGGLVFSTRDKNVTFEPGKIYIFTDVVPRD